MSRALVLSAVLVFLLTSASPTSMLLDEQHIDSVGDADNIIISEILVSPNGMKNTEECTNCYNATDWNGDVSTVNIQTNLLNFTTLLHKPSTSQTGFLMTNQMAAVLPVRSLETQ